MSYARERERGKNEGRGGGSEIQYWENPDVIIALKLLKSKFLNSTDNLLNSRRFSAAANVSGRGKKEL